MPSENVIPREPQIEQQIEESHENQIAEPIESELAESSENTENVEDTEDVGSVESIAEHAEPSLSDSQTKALASYKSYALGRIASKKTYPYAARSQGLEGKVRARVVIHSDGTVAEAELLEKCEHEVLNEACLDAIKKAAPFKKMPKGQKSMTLTFVMDFSLKEKVR
jgi:TonB family protein